MSSNSPSESSLPSFNDAAIIGLGRMGLPQALRLARANFRVRGFDLDPARRNLAAAEGLPLAESLEQACARPPGGGGLAVLVYLPAGGPVEETIEALAGFLRAGDLVLDCGNCYYQDAVRHAGRLAREEIHFLDVGVSGGISGARNGACLMVGGPDAVYRAGEPLLRVLAGPDAILHAGPAGWGHLVKTVHNGIEYGFLQAIAEGLHTIEAKAREENVDVDLKALCETWNRGSIIEARLMADAAAAMRLVRDPELQGRIGGGQTGSWAAEIAEEAGVRVPVLQAAIEARRRSREAPDFSGKVISAIRNVFGSHARE